MRFHETKPELTREEQLAARPGPVIAVFTVPTENPTDEPCTEPCCVRQDPDGLFL
jgi:hypothetical protein